MNIDSIEMYCGWVEFKNEQQSNDDDSDDNGNKTNQIELANACPCVGHFKLTSFKRKRKGAMIRNNFRRRRESTILVGIVVIDDHVYTGKHQNHACPSPQQYENCLKYGTAQKEVKPIVFQHEPKDASIVLVLNFDIIAGLRKYAIAIDQSREGDTTWSTSSDGGN
jgi:hypothetical protein